MRKPAPEVPIGDRIRVAGTLGISMRGPAILDTAGVPVWILCVPLDYALPIVDEVVVEGIRSGLDRIDVDWAGAA